MVKNIKSKKGIFFTALLVLMSSTLLTLSVLSFHNSLESEKRFVELSSLDMVYNLHSSVENTIIKIFFIVTERNYDAFNYQEDSIEFDWNLNIDEFNEIIIKLNALNNFLVQKYPFIVLSISTPPPNFIAIDINVNPPGIHAGKKWKIKIK